MPPTRCPSGMQGLRIPIPISVCLTLDERKQHTKANTSRNHTTLSQTLVRSCTCSILMISVFLIIPRAGRVRVAFTSRQGALCLYSQRQRGAQLPRLFAASLLLLHRRHRRLRRRRRRRPGDEWLTRWMHRWHDATRSMMMVTARRRSPESGKRSSRSSCPHPVLTNTM